MAVYAVAEQAYPTRDEIRDQILSNIAFAYAAQGLTANVQPGSDHYIRADAYAAQASIAIANGRIARSAISPLTAQGDDLLELAAVYGVPPRPAAKSSGFVIIRVPLVPVGTPAAIVTIPAGYVCTAPNGFKYQTRSVHTGGLGSKVELESLIAGVDTNQAAGVKLTWDSSAVGQLLSTCTVDSGGIDGGADTDGVEVVRRRLLQRLAFPGVGGNTAHAISLAEESTASIEYAFAYAAARGPGSYNVAVTAAGGDRTLSGVPLSAAAAGIIAELPGHTSLVVTSVNAEEVDVVFEASLPLPANAGGEGGGWRDASPWPAEVTKVTGYSAPVATVDSVASPAVGQQIGIWDPDAEVMREYTIISCGGPSGAYQIQVQGGFLANPEDAYVSAGAFNLTQYAATALAEFQKLGPGEITDSVDLLPRARRQPTGAVLAQPSINSRIITGIETAHGEIALEYAARYETGTTTPITGPSVPATTADPPNIIVLKHLAFIKA